MPSADDFLIREATPEDAAVLAHFLSAFNGEPVDAAAALRRMTAAHATETIFFAVLADVSVGFCSVRIQPFLSGDEPYAEITELYVEPEWRRRGIGQALMHAAEGLAHRRGGAQSWSCSSARGMP